MGVYVIVCVLNIGVTSGWSKILNYKYFKSYSNIPYSHIPINYMKSQLLMDTIVVVGNQWIHSDRTHFKLKHADWY